MPKKKPAAKPKPSPGLSDEAVAKRTGKTWEEWSKVLDRAGARKWSHKEIALWIDQHHPEVGAWWGQMVTVGYERMAGLRVRNEKADGFEISVSKTLPVAVERAFDAWVDEAERKLWLTEPRFSIRKANPAKSLRCSWGESADRLSVEFYPVGEEKTRVTVQHGKLATAAAGEKLKKSWGAALEKLAEYLGRD